MRESAGGSTFVLSMKKMAVSDDGLSDLGTILSLFALFSSSDFVIFVIFIHRLLFLGATPP